MPEIKAHLRYLRISPRKVRLCAEVMRGKSVKDAGLQLRALHKGGAEPLHKLLRSAVANAKHNFNITDTEALVVKSVRVDKGPTLKRSMPRARGSAAPIRKRMSHISLVLDQK
jgi:large subunit ribosomal protein L22